MKKILLFFALVLSLLSLKAQEHGTTLLATEEDDQLILALDVEVIRERWMSRLEAAGYEDINSENFANITVQKFIEEEETYYVLIASDVNNTVRSGIVLHNENGQLYEKLFTLETGLVGITVECSTSCSTGCDPRNYGGVTSCINPCSRGTCTKKATSTFSTFFDNF